MTGVQAHASMNIAGESEKNFDCCKEEQVIESCHNTDDNCCRSSCFSYSDQEIIKNENKNKSSLIPLILSSFDFPISPYFERFTYTHISLVPQGASIRSVVQRE